jgi:inosine-uridine nucleoside N-ribohydrolase
MALWANTSVADDLRRARAPKVIIDTDFNTIGDDGQVAAMAAQLHARGAIDLLGLTVASGNQWLNQGVSDALKAVERLGIERGVKVYVGAQYPLLHDYKSYLYEQMVVGPPVDYVGAFASAPTAPDRLVPPPDGFATHTRPAELDAVDFIIETVHRYPHEVTILEIAPPTNLALAIRKDPSIVPLINKIVTMAGQIYAPGNAYLDTTALAFLVDPTLATDVRDLWLDVSTTFDRNYGKSVVYLSDPYPSIQLLQKSKVIFKLDQARFYAFYAELLTSPVPVRINGPRDR